MSKSNSTETDILRKIFNGTPLPWDAVSNLYVSLYTGDPGEAGDQTTNEADYTGYARVAVSRDASGWVVAGNTVSNAAEITFPQCTGGANTITHWAVGTLSSGAGQILYSGALNQALTVSNLITPRVLTGQAQIQED